RVLTGDDPNVESKAIEGPRQAVQDQPCECHESHEQRAACNRNRAQSGLSESMHKSDEPGGKACGEAAQQSADDLGHALRLSLRRRHVQSLTEPSMRRIRSTSSRGENGFVTYSSAPSESPFS